MADKDAVRVEPHSNQGNGTAPWLRSSLVPHGGGTAPAAEVEGFLDQHPGFLDRLAAAPTINPAKGQQIAEPDLDKIIEDPPEKTVAPATTSKPWLSRKAQLDPVLYRAVI